MQNKSEKSNWLKKKENKILEIQGWLQVEMVTVQDEHMIVDWNK